MGGRVLLFLLRYGYDGRIYPLNPQSDEIFGLRCYPDIRSLPEAPDVVIMAIPKQLIYDPIAQCCERGVKNAVIISGGFAEIGDAGPIQPGKAEEPHPGSSLRSCRTERHRCYQHAQPHADRGYCGA